MDGQLITNKLLKSITEVSVRNGLLESNPGNDILKIVVVNRYNDTPIAKAFIKNFGLKKGAIASLLHTTVIISLQLVWMMKAFAKQ